MAKGKTEKQSRGDSAEVHSSIGMSHPLHVLDLIIKKNYYRYQYHRHSSAMSTLYSARVDLLNRKNATKIPTQMV